MPAANEVKIDVRSDTRGVDFGAARRESAGLRAAVTKDIGDIKKASGELAKARAREADAAGTVRVAETRLSELRDSGKAKASQLAAAEERLAAAHRKATAAQEAAAAAAERLDAARSGADDQAAGGIDVDRAKAQVTALGRYAASELKTAGTVAGAALAGGIGTGMSSAAAAGIFVGLAAAAQSSTPEVAAAYRGLWDQVKAGARDASSSLADDFVDTAEQLGRTFNDLRPQMADAFAASQPAVENLTDGVDLLARNAMPGLVDAAEASGEATEGMTVMMERAGRGVAAFFSESSRAAPAASRSFEELGSIIERLGSFGGRMLATLAEGGSSVLPSVTSAVDATATAVEGLAEVALPALASGATVAFGGLTLMMNLVSSLLTVLGPAAPMLATFATGLKAIDLVSFGGVKRGWDSLKDSVREAPDVSGKAKAGMLGLAATMGPLGLAAGIAGLAISALAEESQEAAQRQAAMRDVGRSVAQVLREQNGLINEQVRQHAAERASQEGLLDLADRVGVSKSRLVDAMAGERGAYENVQAQIAAYIQTKEREYAIESGRATGSSAEAKRKYEELEAARQLQEELGRENSERDAALAKMQALDEAAGKATGSSVALSTEQKALSEAFATVSDAASDTAAKLEALQRIQQALTSQNESVEEYKAQWNELIDVFGADGKIRAVSDALLTADGTIRTTTADGRELRSTVMEMQEAFLGTATSMRETGASAEDTRQVLAGQRAEFIALMDSIGLTGQQAALLADQYGLIPDSVVTTLYNNSPEVMTQIQGVHDKLRNLPPSTPVYVDALTAEAAQRLNNIGIQTRSLPNGQVEVTAATGGASATLSKWMAYWSSQTLRLGVAAIGGPYGARPGPGYAHGGIPHAVEGGARTGPVLVNERGIESATLPRGDTVMLPTGSIVNTHEDTMRRMVSQSGTRDVRVLFDFTGVEGSATRFFVELLRGAVRQQGGDVQLVLGGGR